MKSIFSLMMVAETLRIAVPYGCAALAGMWAERAGVVHIGLEGVLLASAFSGVAVAHASGSAWVGLALGVAAGAALSLAHAAVVIRLRVHAVLSGIALNLFALAGTRLMLRALYDSASNSPAIEGFRFGPTGPTGAQHLARVLADPTFALALVVTLASPLILQHTRFGLRVRAAGEHPAAAESTGIVVPRVRYLALALSGAICAVGGVHLAFDQHAFESGMSNGRGFIALAAVVVAGWRPLPIAVACLAFAALEALQVVAQDAARKSLLGPLVPLLPYVATLVVLAFAAGRDRAPRALGRDDVI